MNALFLALEERGYVVAWPKKEDDRFTVSADGESAAVSMQEVLDSESHKLTPAEQKHPWTAAKWDYKLTGRLGLSVDNMPHINAPLRSMWADGKVQILENCIGEFIVGIKVAAAVIKKNRLERETWARCQRSKLCKTNGCSLLRA